MQVRMPAPVLACWMQVRMPAPVLAPVPAQVLAHVAKARLQLAMVVLQPLDVGALSTVDRHMLHAVL